MIRGKAKKKKNNVSTMQLIVISFALAVVVGTLILMLPISSADGSWTSLIDALFTAASSVCVSGLAVVDTCTYWSLFGQIVILIMIQLGGLGIISFTTLLFILIGKRITLKDRLVVMDSFNLSTLSGLIRFLFEIFKITFFMELIGALFYLVRFIPRFGLIKGVWVSLFISVSAFCNSGLDIIGSNSFAEYVRDPYINIVTMLLVVSGGIGFIVWWDVKRVLGLLIRKSIHLDDVWVRMSVHSKIVIIMTAILIFGGAAMYFVLEYNNMKTIGSFTLPEKLMMCLFQSVNTRTAGFSVISQSELTDAATFLTMILMFIGGSPVGTAGGIKTTTVAVVMLEAWSMIKGRENTVVFNRTIPVLTMRKGIMVLCISILCLFAFTTLLLAVNTGDFKDIVFETVSALGTAGLTRDFTDKLSLAGRVIIIICIYLGRIGPVSLAIAFSSKNTKLAGQYKEEDITVG